MFNVTVLKMRDIIKYFIGIIFILLILLYVTKYFNKDTKEGKIVQEVEKRIKILSENTMLESIDKTLPSIATINEEYKNIANEDDKVEENTLLQETLKTQISSIRGIEKIEQKEQQEIEVANQEKTKNNNGENAEDIQLARNRPYYTSNNK